MLNLEIIQQHIINVRGEKVILDSDIAKLYQVETKRINEAVKNNPDKFPEGYIIELDKDELLDLRTKISTAKLSKTRSNPKAFTEKGLYMLATILKSKSATVTTIQIIETFAKIRELSSNIRDLEIITNEEQKDNLLKRSGEIITEIFDDELKVTGTETSVEINFAVLKFKHLVKKDKKAKVE